PDERPGRQWTPNYEPPRPGDLEESDAAPPPPDTDHTMDEATGGAPDMPPDDDIPPIDDAAAPSDGKVGARDLARRYLAQHATHPDGVTLRRWRGEWYLWHRGRGSYVEQTEERIEVNLYNALPLGKRSDVADVSLALRASAGVL